MPIFFGVTATSQTNNPINIPYKVRSFSLANKTGGGITVSVGVVFGSAVTYWLYNKALAAGENYVWLGEEISVEPNYSIFVSASGACDYYFSII